MNRILSKRNISENAIRFEIATSISVKDIKPGHYIIIRRGQDDLGIPLPVVRINVTQATITLIVLIFNDYTRQLAGLNAGSNDFEIEGPFGDPLLIENFGTVLCIGRGSGILPLLPILTELRAAGNQVISVLSAPSQEELIFQNEISATSDEVKLITDDGSSGEKKSLCQVVSQVLRNQRINQVIVIGPAETIRETFSHTAKFNVPTQAVLYPWGIPPELHGIFRVRICGDVRSVCVDGYNFNAWYPNFEEMLKRFGARALEEKKKMNDLKELTVPV